MITCLLGKLRGFKCLQALVGEVLPKGDLRIAHAVAALDVGGGGDGWQA